MRTPNILELIVTAGVIELERTALSNPEITAQLADRLNAVLGEHGLTDASTMERALDTLVHAREGDGNSLFNRAHIRGFAEVSAADATQAVKNAIADPTSPKIACAALSILRLEAVFHAMDYSTIISVGRGAKGRKKIGTATLERIRKAAEPLRRTMTKSKAAEHIANDVGITAERVRRYLSELFPGEKWNSS